MFKINVFETNGPTELKLYMLSVLKTYAQQKNHKIAKIYLEILKFSKTQSQCPLTIEMFYM